MQIAIPVIIGVVLGTVVYLSVGRRRKPRCPECHDKMIRQVRPMAISGTEQYWECDCGYTIDIQS